MILQGFIILNYVIVVLVTELFLLKITDRNKLIFT